MKKLLFTLGSIALVTIPVAAVISCGSNSYKSKAGLGIDTVTNNNSSAQNAHQYPILTSQIEDDLESYALPFAQLKGIDYLEKYRSMSSDKQNIVEYTHIDPNNQVTYFNYHELYDYAHDQDAKLNHQNQFPYLNN